MTQQNAVFQGKYVLGSKSAVGDPRRKWEDRVFVGEIKRTNDDSLIVGIVADGVGSADFGARGAQLAIDTVLKRLEKSEGNDIPAVIELAIQAANIAVFRDNQKNDGDGLTTLVVCVIFNERCYVGNVGDSRAYWLQANPNKTGKVLQLTRDHSYFNIYGGDPNSQEAGILVNAIGKKEQVQVDCGFYLKGDDFNQAYQLGLKGLPLKQGDTVLLCSDGLIKSSPSGNPYIQPNEMLDACQTESESDMAAIKMVSRAEGRRPDDNVSAVTIQYLSPEVVKAMKARSEQSKKIRQLVRVGLGVLTLLVLILIGSLSFKVVSYANAPTATPIFITNTPMPSPTITPTVVPGEASVHEVSGGSANLMKGQQIKPGTEISTGNSGVRIVVGEIGGNGVMYWFGVNSTGTINFDSTMMKPVLKSGALYIEPGSGGAEVHFTQPDIVATVSGSRMIVELKGNEILVYCFEGKCGLQVGLDAKIIPVMNFISYDIVTKQWTPSSGASEMSYDQQWSWNVSCGYCMAAVVPSPTPTITPVRLQSGEPTKKPQNNDVNPGGTP